MKRTAVPPLPKLLLTGGICLVSGYLALLLVGEDLAPAIFWPPAGIALGTALIWGLGVIPAAFLGTVAGAALWDTPWQSALLLGLAASIQAVAGTLLLRRAGFAGRLSHLVDLIRLVLHGGLLAGGLAAGLSCIALLGGDWLWEVSPLRGAGTLIMAHLLAALVFAPILICRPTAVCPKPLGRPWETAAVLLLLLATTVVLAHPTLLGLSAAVFRPYPLMPFLLWLALRSSPFHTALGIGMVYAVAATGSGHGMSHLFMLRPDVGIAPIHGFVFIIGATFMALAVVMVSRALVENALRSSEARLRNVIGLIRNCLWETDAQGRFVFLDSHVESVFALPAESMLGHRPEEIWPDTLGPAMADLFRATLDGRTARCESHAYRRRDGEMAYLETNCAPLVDANGRHLGWQGITREVSERVRMARDLDESHRRFRQLADNIQEVFWVSERLERFVYISPKCEEVTGLPSTALYADYTTWQKLIHDADKAYVAAAWNKVRQRQPIDLEFRMLHPVKGVRWVWVRSIPFDDNDGVPMNAGILEDITERKQAEQAHIAQLVAHKDALIREVHHRIKNNLQTVVGLLRREAGKHPEAKEAIEAAIAQVQSVAVVHGLHGRVTQHTIMLCELLPAVVANVAELTGTAINLGGVPAGCGQLVVKDNETVAVALILNELVTNAVKHAQAGGAPPEVALQREDHTGRIRIANAGGLPPDFDFPRGAGLGTGLSLVKALRPAPGMDIAFCQAGDRVEVEVVIGAPVLQSVGVDSMELPAPRHALHDAD